MPRRARGQPPKHEMRTPHSHQTPDKYLQDMGYYAKHESMKSLTPHEQDFIKLYLKNYHRKDMNSYWHLDNVDQVKTGILLRLELVEGAEAHVVALVPELRRGSDGALVCRWGQNAL